MRADGPGRDGDVIGDRRQGSASGIEQVADLGSQLGDLRRHLVSGNLAGGMGSVRCPVLAISWP